MSKQRLPAGDLDLWLDQENQSVRGCVRYKAAENESYVEEPTGFDFVVENNELYPWLDEPVSETELARRLLSDFLARI